MFTRFPPVSLGIACVILAACTPSLHSTDSPFRDALLSVETSLGNRSLNYQDANQTLPFSPDGMAPDTNNDRAVWLTSSQHTTQIQITVLSDGSLVTGKIRQGPPRTRRCFVTPPQTTWCIGERQPGGLFAIAEKTVCNSLPLRGGFVDGFWEPLSQKMFVLDSVEPAVWRLDADGILDGVFPVSGVVRQLVGLGDGATGVILASPPGIAVVLRDTNQTLYLPWVAPQRAATYDRTRDVLWTVGPATPQPRRDTGPIRSFSAGVFGWDAKALRQGRAQPVAQLLLGPLGYADPTSVSVIQESLLITLGANDAILWWNPQQQPIPCPTEPYPAQSWPFADGGMVVARLGDSAQWFPYPNSCVSHTIYLDFYPREDMEHLGERLFYRVHDKQVQTDSPHTCNSCHWDAGKDHRLQPGFLEQRWEMTRPLAGINAVLPLFTTGFGHTMTDSVEGLVRGLDTRFWNPDSTRDPYWLKPTTLRIKGGKEITLSAAQQREALLTYLMSLKPAVGPLRLADGGFSEAATEGARLFWQHCAHCHQPRTTLRSGNPEFQTQPTTPEMMLQTLKTQPLVFGAKAFVHIPGVVAFTPHGNRISPLVELWRGGPYFSDGSAPDLATVLRQFVPGKTGGHMSTPPMDAGFSEQDIEKIRTFLLSL